jgi:hypothetical protein
MREWTQEGKGAMTKQADCGGDSLAAAALFDHLLPKTASQ